VNRWTLDIVFVLSFAAALAATTPMGLTLFLAAPAGMSAAAVSGSIWNARVEAAHYRGVPLGNVELSLDPFALFRGTQRLAVKGPLGQATLVQGGVRGFETADVELAVEHLRLAPGFSGELQLRGATVLFADGLCVRAQGSIATDVLGRAFGGPEISGALACVGDAAIAQLQGRTQDSDVRVMLRLDGQGRYEAETHVATSNVLVRNALPLAGFTERADGFVRLDEGAFGS
jgi:hypothetical protein